MRKREKGIGMKNDEEREEEDKKVVIWRTCKRKRMRGNLKGEEVIVTEEKRGLYRD